MQEIDRTLYSQVTFQHDGTVAVSSIVETCLVDDAGKILGVKSSRGVNFNVDPKKQKKALKLAEQLAQLSIDAAKASQ